MRSRRASVGIGPGSPEVLEGRTLLVGAAGEVTLLGASTADSKGVTVDYRVDGSDLARPIEVAVYRSSDPMYDAGDVLVGSGSVEASPVGTHRATVALAGGLPPNPRRPFVIAVADPGTPGASAPDRQASFRKHVLGVVVHGGAQSPGAEENGPDWQRGLVGQLREQGYEWAISFVWASESWTPGAAAKQGPRLARLIERAAAQFPPGEPVDLHLIGHSEGTVITGLALHRLQKLGPSPEVAAGYVELTLLDPHPASNANKRPKYDTGGNLLGWLAGQLLSNNHSRANDPPALVPRIVDDAQVFIQKTPLALAGGGGIPGVYTIWGQVPVRSAPGVPVHVADLTGPGINHESIRDWYRTNLAPRLGDGPAFLDPGHLTATRDASASTFSGTALPGAPVLVFAVGRGSDDKVEVGRTTSDASGHWSLSPDRPMPSVARYFARALVPAAPGRKYAKITPTVRVGVGDLAVGGVGQG